MSKLTTEYIHQTLNTLKTAIATAEAELKTAHDPIVREALEGTLASADLTRGVVAQSIDKCQLIKLMKLGYTLSEIFPLTSSQICQIYKAPHFNPGARADVIVYIPDLTVYDLSVDKIYTKDEDLVDVVAHCFSSADFITECERTTVTPEDLFGYVNWQSPSAALPELVKEAN